VAPADANDTPAAPATKAAALQQDQQPGGGITQSPGRHVARLRPGDGPRPRRVQLRPREGTIGVPRLGSALRPLADEFPWQTSGSTLV
jgi:hypothetical protein